MAEALAENEDFDEVELERRKKESLEIKRKALQSERVTDFIKKGPSEEAEVAAEKQEEHRVKEVTEYLQLNVRIPSNLLMRVKRAAFENKASNLEPSTVQGVVIQALTGELRKMGY